MMSDQVKALVEELSQRDDARIKLAEAQTKIQSLIKDKQVIEQGFKLGQEQFKNEISSLKRENIDLNYEISKVQQQLRSHSANKSQEISMVYLKEDNVRLEKLQATLASDKESLIRKSKEMSTKIVATEQRLADLQKKYDEQKRAYFKIREDRERLKAELEKTKAIPGSEGSATTLVKQPSAISSEDKGPNSSTMTASGQNASIADSKAAGSGAKPTTGGEVHAKYEILKTKYRVSAYIIFPVYCLHEFCLVC